MLALFNASECITYPKRSSEPTFPYVQDPGRLSRVQFLDPRLPSRIGFSYQSNPFSRSPRDRKSANLTIRAHRAGDRSPMDQSRARLQYCSLQKVAIYFVRLAIFWFWPFFQAKISFNHLSDQCSDQVRFFLYRYCFFSRAGFSPRDLLY